MPLVHGALNGYTIPFVCIFLKRKTRVLHHEPLNELKKQPVSAAITNKNWLWNHCCRKFQVNVVFLHPTMMKFLQYLRKEQNFTENRIARVHIAKNLPVNAKMERYNRRFLQVFRYCQKNELLSVLEAFHLSLIHECTLF